MHQSAGATGPPSTATALCSFLVIVIPQDAGHLGGVRGRDAGPWGLAPCCGLGLGVFPRCSFRGPLRRGRPPRGPSPMLTERCQRARPPVQASSRSLWASHPSPPCGRRESVTEPVVGEAGRGALGAVTWPVRITRLIAGSPDPAVPRAQLATLRNLPSIRPHPSRLLDHRVVQKPRLAEDAWILREDLRPWPGIRSMFRGVLDAEWPVPFLFPTQSVP